MLSRVMNKQVPRSSGASEPADSDIVPAGRREAIAALVAEVSPISVRTLAAKFAVSSDTIRRDLDQLAQEGRIARTHGGAMSITSNDGGPAHSTPALTPGKRVVGALAAQLVEDGAVLMINAGATPVALVHELDTRRDLTIVTNNLMIPPAISAKSCRSMHVLGGEVRLEGQSTIGSVKQQLAGSGLDVRADLAIISVGGVTIERGYSVADLTEATMLHEMMARASKVAVLADSLKLGRQLFASVASLGEADYFVTDSPPPPEFRDALSARDVQIILP